MCGLVGVFGNALIQKETDIFRCMLLLDVIRGEHSTGVFMELSKNNVRGTVTLKAPGYPSRLFDRYPEIFDEKGTISSSFNDHKTNIRLLLGHNRQATVGGVSLDNAHPFVIDHIAGAHNGTIRIGVNDLKKELEGRETTGSTDSEGLLTKLSRTGCLQETFDGLTGAAALSYYDKKERQLNLYRNGLRSLYYALSKSNGTLIWASERMIIERALLRTKAKAQYNDPVEVPENKLLTFTLKGHRVEQIEETPVTLLEKPKSRTTGAANTGMSTQQGMVVHAGSRITRYPGPAGVLGGAPFRPEIINTHERNRAEESARTFLEDAGLNNDKKELEDEIPFGFGPSAGWLDPLNQDEDRLKASLRYGCQLCQGDLDWEDYLLGGVKWLEPDTPLCSNCAKEMSYESY